MVHIWLIDHCCHCLFDVSLTKLVFGVLIPYGFEVEPWSVEVLFQEAQASSVGDACTALVVVFVVRQHPTGVCFRIFVTVSFDCAFEWFAGLGVRDDGERFATSEMRTRNVNKLGRYGLRNSLVESGEFLAAVRD